MVLLISRPVLAQDQARVAKEHGFQENRSYFSGMPFENIDTLNGNVILTFTDLALPGDAGNEVRFQRIYNSKEALGGIGPWRFGLAGVPMSIFDHLNPPDPAKQLTTFRMADGAEQRTTFLDGGLDQGRWLVSGNFWRYDRETQRLFMPDGTVCYYVLRSQTALSKTLQLEKIEDPFGNQVLIGYDAQLRMASVVQKLKNNQERVVALTYADPNAVMPQTMSYEGRVWNYEFNQVGFRGPLLTKVAPPASSPWQYSYADANSGELTQVTTPHGGTISYSYDTYNFPRLQPTELGSVPSRVVKTRSIGGAEETNITAATWNYEYSTVAGPPNSSGCCEQTAIVWPNGSKRVRYLHAPIGNEFNLGGDWGVYHVYVDRPNGSGGFAEVEHEERTYVAVLVGTGIWGTGYRAIQDSTTITRAGSATVYKTQHYFDPTLPQDGGRFSDYHRPRRTVETGDFVRETIRDYDYDFVGLPGRTTPPGQDLLILAKIASEEVQVDNLPAYKRKWTYNNSTGFVESSKSYGQGTTEGQETTYVPDSAGNVASSTVESSDQDTLDRTTSFDYEWGVATTVHTPAYNVQRSANFDGTIISETRGPRQTTFEYDTQSRPTRTKPAGGTYHLVTTYDNVNGRTITVARGATFTTTTLDGFGRPIKTVNAKGEQTTTRYDADGQKTFESYPHLPGAERGTTITYDVLGRVTSRTESGSPATIYDYTGLDIAITETVAPGHTRVTHQELEATGHPDNTRLTAVVDAKNKRWTYTYNTLGRLTSVTTPDAKTRTWVYDSKDRLSSESHPESGTRTLAYDGVGNIKTEQNARGITFTYTHDLNNRVTSVTATGNGLPEVTTISYETGTDNRWQVKSPYNVTTDFRYDTAGRVESRKDTIDQVTPFLNEFRYDNNDNLTELHYSTDRVVKYQYDTVNRITRVAGQATLMDPETVYAKNFEYHPSGAVKAYTSGNDIRNVFDFEPNRYWPTKACLTRTANATECSTAEPNFFFEETYSQYDFIGNPRRIDAARPNLPPLGHNYSYDELDRLFFVAGTWGDTWFQYDDHGNRKIGEGNYDATLRLQQQGDTSFVYDNAGNMTERIGPAGGTYAYDANNMMKSASPGSSSYKYDADQQRFAQEVNGKLTYFSRSIGGQVLTEWSASPFEATREFVYAGSRIIATIKPPAGSGPGGPTGPGGPGNPSPFVVTITSPLDNTEFQQQPNQQSITVQVQATASHPTGIASVQFLMDGVALGAPVTGSSPYTVQATIELPAWEYRRIVRFVAVATNGNGVTLASEAVGIIVKRIGTLQGVLITPNPVGNNRQATFTITGVSPCSTVGIRDGRPHVDGTPNGEITLNGGEMPYDITWNFLDYGDKTVIVRGQGNCTGEITQTIEVRPDNYVPKVTIDTPIDGATFPTNAPVAFRATAFDRAGWNGGGQIAQVQFFAGTTLIGQDSTEPYEAMYTFPDKGTYQVFARAIDNLGLAGDSTPITVNIANLATLSVSSPVIAGVEATITVTGSNPCGGIKLTYGDGPWQHLGTSDGALPEEFKYTWAQPGTYTLTAEGFGDCSGALTTQVVVAAPNTLPSVTLTSPANNTGFAPHPNITLTATASDPDGTITRVQFFADGQPLSVPGDTTAPYEYVWSDAPNGQHTLFARAYDDSGLHMDSAPVFITVQHLTDLTITKANVAPPAFGAMSHHGVANNTLIFQHTVGAGPNRYLVVGLNAWKSGAGAPTVTSVTYAGIPMSRIGRQAAMSEGRAVELWGLAAPPVGQEHVVVTTADAMELTAGAHSWFNVNQTTPTGAPVGAQAETVTIASAPNEVVVDVFGYYAPTPTVGAGQTALWKDDNTLDGAAGSYEAGASSVTMSWTSGTQWPAILAVALKPVAAGGGVGLTAGQTATITVTAVEPCEGVVIDFGDGSSPVPLSQQPFVTTHVWTTPGVKTVTATGQGSCTGVLVRNVEVLPNQPPSVQLTAPDDNATFSAGSTIYLSADASDSDDSVARVEFSSGATHIGTDDTGPGPYTAQWVDVQPGTHTLTATAFDTAGGSSTSSRTVTVTHLKGVTITPSTVYVGQYATITVDYVAAGCGAIGLNADDGQGEHVQNVLSPPQVISWARKWDTQGTKTLTIRGVGNCTGLLMPTITVNPNNAPSVELTAPANGATVQAPGPVTVSAIASDSDGGIKRVDFYANNELIGSDDTPSPYAIEWTGMSTGPYTLKAVAVDNFNASTESDPRSVNATYIGSVTVSPSTVVVGQNTTITVNYGAGCGAIGINASDGQGEIVYQLQPPYPPISVQRFWSTTGPKTITVKGHGAPCANGDVTTTVTVNGNTPSTVSLIAPANGATVQAPGPVMVSASATDSDGVKRVDFYANNELIGSDDTPSPYEIAWTGISTGPYTLKAVAVDNFNASTESDPRSVNATYIGSVTVSPSTVVTGQPATITVNYGAGCGAIGINASDGQGEIVYQLQPPYPPISVQRLWSTTGPKTITVKGHGAPCANGDVTTTVTVNANTVPTVLITAPANGANVLAPGPVTVTANASDGDGIQRVEFLADGVVFETDMVAPYSGTWSGITGGAHTLTVKAYDTWAAVGQAAITVNATHLTGISVSPNPIVAGTSGTVTVTGSSACANVTINWGDGTQPQTLAQQLPATATHVWAAAGQRTVTATGVQPCAGTVSTTLTVNGNTGPSVTLTSPAHGASYQAPGSIYLAANASDPQGVNRVEFHHGSGHIFTDTVAPYEYTWSNVPAGTYHVFAIAYDQLNAPTQTGAATITVNNGVLGGISASTPRRQGDQINFTVTGTNPCGAIHFNFGDGVAYTPSSGSLPYTEGHAYSSGGWKTITATGQGNCTGTVSTQIYVDAKPNATLTTPSHGQTYLAPASIPINVTATDDIMVDRVEFYLNGGHWSTDPSGPYQLTLNSVGAGTYTIFARAYDNAGSMTQTTTATVTVNNPGPSMVTSVEISPSPVGVNQSANVIVYGSNPCGAVEVNFGDGSVVQTYPITQLPAYFSHTWTTAGQKTVTAIGHGNCSGQTSTVVTVQ